jgi:hypothetical protein
MTPVKTMRRAVAKIRHDEAAEAIPHVGHKRVHHFWPLLSPCFREVLVAPHRRTDEDAVTWTWREPAEDGAPKASELDELRRRFESALDRFSRDVAAGKVGRGSGSTAAGVAGNAEQLEAVMTTVVKDFVGRSDADLSRYVCRTEHGLRVHSWGAGAPARPVYPDTHGLEIAGRVLVAGQPARHDVVLESSDGETIAEVPSDEGGEFSFSKLSPGEYRLRARSVRGTFPPNGLPVDLQQRSVKGLVLADSRAESVSPLISARRAAGRRSRRLLPFVVAVLAAAGGWWSWRSFNSVDGRIAASTPTAPGADTRGADRAESASASVSPVRVVSPTAAGAGTGAATASSAGGTIAFVSAALKSERRALAVEGREPGSGPFPGSSSGAVAGGNVPPPAVGPGGSTPAGNAPVATTHLRIPTAPSAQAAVVADGGTPAGLPPVAAATAAPAPSARPPLPAPGAPAAAPPAPSSPAPSSPAATPTAPLARNLESSPDPIAAPVVAVEPVSPPPAAAVTPATPPAADADVPRPEVPRVPAGTVSSPGPVVPHEAVHEKVIPFVPTPVAVVPAPAVVSVPAPVAMSPTMVRAAPVPLTRAVRVRVSPWRARLLVDTILPTTPTPMTKPEPVAVLRARLLAEQEARLPQAFRDVDGRFGVAIELSPEGANEALAWQDDTGSSPEFARVSGPRAELLWPASTDESERVYRLARRDGGMAAEVRVVGNGRDFSVRTMEESRVWLRLAVRVASSEAASPAPGASAKGVEWRSAAAGPLPLGWREVENPSSANERGVDVPLGSVPGAAALQAGALFDLDTGWAILADVRQAADRPLGQ